MKNNPPWSLIFFLDSLKSKRPSKKSRVMAQHKSSESDMECIKLLYESLNMKRMSRNPLSCLNINPMNQILILLSSFLTP